MIILQAQLIRIASQDCSAFPRPARDDVRWGIRIPNPYLGRSELDFFQGAVFDRPNEVDTSYGDVAAGAVDDIDLGVGGAKCKWRHRDAGAYTWR